MVQMVSRPPSPDTHPLPVPIYVSGINVSTLPSFPRHTLSHQRVAAPIGTGRAALPLTPSTSRTMKRHGQKPRVRPGRFSFSPEFKLSIQIFGFDALKRALKRASNSRLRNREVRALPGESLIRHRASGAVPAPASVRFRLCCPHARIGVR